MESLPSAELDAAIKIALAKEVEQLVAMGMERKKARRAVWDDYLAELNCHVHPPAAPPPKAEPLLATPKPPPEGHFFTPERLRKNRQALAKVKQLVGLRSN